MYGGNNKRGRGGKRNRHGIKQEPRNHQRNQNNHRNFHDDRDWKRPRQDGWSNAGLTSVQFGYKSEPHQQYNAPVKYDPNYHKAQKVEPKKEPKIEEEMSPLPEINFEDRELEVLQRKRETAFEGCVFIDNVPKGVTKEQLATYIVHQYMVYEGNSPKIVACSIRADRCDAFVEFEDVSHALYASHILHDQDFRGCNPREENILRVTGRDEHQYWQGFYAEARNRKQKEEERERERVKAEAIALDAAEDGEVAVVESPRVPQLEYFQKQIKESNCIHISGLPKGFGPKDLKHFIMKQSKKRLVNLTPKITACHLRSGYKDACVEFESNMSQIFTILHGPINGEYFQKAKWNAALSKKFLKHYQEKEERKRLKKEEPSNPSDTSNSVPNPSENKNQDSANDSPLQKELVRLKEEMKRLEKKRDRKLKDERSRAARQIAILKYNRNEVKELAEKLNQVEEEADTLRFNFSEVQKDNAEQQKEIEDVKEEIENSKTKLHMLQQAHEASKVARSNLQVRIVEMESENLELNRNLDDAQQDLENAREQRVQAEQTLISARAQSGNERDNRLVRVKQEVTYGAQEIADCKRECKRLTRLFMLLIGKDLTRASSKTRENGPAKVMKENQ